MAHWLNASELAEVCNELGLVAEESALIAAAQAAAVAIAAKLDIIITIDAYNDPGFAGLCAGFAPAREGQAIPDIIAPCDEGSDWALGDNSL